MADVHAIGRRIEADLDQVPTSTIWGILPGAHYGRDDEEILVCNTHSDGPNITEENGGVVHITLKDNAGDITIKVGKTSKGTSRWALKDGVDILYAVGSYSADWATAEASKFEKGDDKKDDKKGGAPPMMPHHDED